MMDGKCIEDWEHAHFSFYRYVPSLAAAAAFAAIFGISTLMHVFQMVRSRTWYLIPFVIGCFCETGGYAARAYSASQKPGCWTLNPYLVQTLLILIAPAFMAASIYMILGRIILLTEGERLSLIRRTWLTKIFVAGDILAILVQGSGGGMLASADGNQNTMKLGNDLVIVGLFIQIVTFGLFVLVASVFHKRMSSRPTPKVQQRPEIRWRAYLVMLYVTSAMIWIRSLFRAIEYIQGEDGYLLRTEAFIYVFDATLLTIAVYWLNWFHPAEIGLLLKGEWTITNGIELLVPGRRGGGGGGGRKDGKGYRDQSGNEAVFQQSDSSYNYN